MSPRYFALIAGVVYISVSVLGFMFGITQPPSVHTSSADSNYGYFLGLLPAHVLRHLVHLALGIWGGIAYLQLASARIYARGMAIICGLLALLGLFPGLSTIFGLVPLFGYTVWLYLLTALAAVYFGFLLPEAEVTVRAPELRGRPGRREPEERPGAHF
ncbi:MAG: DUF4383 domain-containing protein [Candidatus Binatia bacterium]